MFLRHLCSIYRIEDILSDAFDSERSVLSLVSDYSVIAEMSNVSCSTNKLPITEGGRLSGGLLYRGPLMCLFTIQAWETSAINWTPLYIAQLLETRGRIFSPCQSQLGLLGLCGQNSISEFIVSGLYSPCGNTKSQSITV
jgi:hypothetical protein